MSFLKNNFLLMVSLGLFVLSSFAYGYNEEHLAQLKNCLNGQQSNRCDMSNKDLSGLTNIRKMDLGIMPTLSDFTYLNDLRDVRQVRDLLDIGGVAIRLESGMSSNTFYFTGTDLKDTSIVIDTDQLLIDFTDADLRGAEIFKGDNFPEFLIQSMGPRINWRRAKYDQYTVFPIGFNPEEHGMILVKRCGVFRLFCPGQR